VDHFIKLFSRKFEKSVVKVDAGFIDYVLQHELRGNVRELKNIIEREVILSEDGCIKHTGGDSMIRSNSLSMEIPDEGMNLSEYLASIEHDILQKALKKTSGMKTKAAELLGLTFREFRYKLSKHKDAGDEI
jgi:two-component system response regulator PilR (NtrC family)